MLRHRLLCIFFCVFIIETAVAYQDTNVLILATAEKDLVRIAPDWQKNTVAIGEASVSSINYNKDVRVFNETGDFLFYITQRAAMRAIQTGYLELANYDPAKRGSSITFVKKISLSEKLPAIPPDQDVSVLVLETTSKDLGELAPDWKKGHVANKETSVSSINYKKDVRVFNENGDFLFYIQQNAATRAIQTGYLELANYDREEKKIVLVKKVPLSKKSPTIQPEDKTPNAKQNEPAPSQQDIVAKQRAMAKNRMDQDSKIYSQTELQEIESLYQVANKKGLSSKEAENSLKEMVSKYTNANRTGCALLYLGQMGSGNEQIGYLQQAIDEFSGCFYGDGVQVGAYARFKLSEYYLQRGEKEKAEKLIGEIKRYYPESIDHKGRSLVPMPGHESEQSSQNHSYDQQFQLSDKKKTVDYQSGSEPLSTRFAEPPSFEHGDPKSANGIICNTNVSRIILPDYSLKTFETAREKALSGSKQDRDNFFNLYAAYVKDVYAAFQDRGGVVKSYRSKDEIGLRRDNYALALENFFNKTTTMPILPGKGAFAKTIEGLQIEIQKLYIDDNDAVFIRDGLKQKRIAVSDLSPSSQQLARDLRVDQGFDSYLRISVDKIRGRKWEGPGTISSLGPAESYIYENNTYSITLENRADFPIDNLVVEYQIFFKQTVAGTLLDADDDYRFVGYSIVKAIPAGGKFTITVNPPTITENKFHPFSETLGYTYRIWSLRYPDGYNQKSSGRMRGSWIRVHRITPCGRLTIEAKDGVYPADAEWDAIVMLHNQ